MQNSLGMSVVQDYDRFKKFNIHEVASGAVSRRHNEAKAQTEVVPAAPPGEQDAIPEDPSAEASRDSKGIGKKKRKRVEDVAVND